MNFKDPSSLKVIDSKSNGSSLTLTVTATNSYGAKVQSQLFCQFTSDGKIDTTITDSTNRTKRFTEELRNERLRLEQENRMRGWGG